MKTFYGILGMATIITVVTLACGYVGTKAIVQIDGFINKKEFIKAPSFLLFQSDCEREFLKKHDSMDRDSTRYCDENPESTVW